MHCCVRHEFTKILLKDHVQKKKNLIASIVNLDFFLFLMHIKTKQKFQK